MIADIIGQDRAGEDVLLVEVKNRELSPDLISLYFEAMEAESPSIPYKMLVDRALIYMEKRSVGDLSSTSRLATADILRHYDPDFDNKRISPRYMLALVEAWLEDLVYQIREVSPPGTTELANFGLLSLLEGGKILREVAIGSDSLR